jgi:hypothetical protein
MRAPRMQYAMVAEQTKRTVIDIFRKRLVDADPAAVSRGMKERWAVWLVLD